MAIKVLKVATNLRDSALSYGTTTMQLLNIWFSGWFFISFAFNGSKLVTTPAYINFNGTNWWLYMGAVSLLQALFLVIPSFRCNILAGFVMLISAPMWGVVSINFADAEYFNTGVMAYGGFGFMCGMAGWKLIDLYDFKFSLKRGIEDVRGGNKNEVVVENNDVGKPCIGDERTDNTTGYFCDDRGVDGGVCPCDTEGKA